MLSYVLCFSGATFNHVREVWQGGWLPYHFAPWWTNVFWTTLTFADPLALVLLIWRPRYGVWLTLIIMLLDVGVNTNFALKQGSGFGSGLLAQAAFLGFVLGSAPFMLQKRGGDDAHPHQK